MVRALDMRLDVADAIPSVPAVPLSCNDFEVDTGSRRNYDLFGDIRISYLFDKYSPASGDIVP